MRKPEKGWVNHVAKDPQSSGCKLHALHASIGHWRWFGRPYHTEYYSAVTVYTLLGKDIKDTNKPTIVSQQRELKQTGCNSRFNLYILVAAVIGGVQETGGRGQEYDLEKVTLEQPVLNSGHPLVPWLKGACTQFAVLVANYRPIRICMRIHDAAGAHNMRKLSGQFDLHRELVWQSSGQN